MKPGQQSTSTQRSTSTPPEARGLGPVCAPLALRAMGRRGRSGAGAGCCGWTCAGRVRRDGAFGGGAAADGRRVSDAGDERVRGDAPHRRHARQGRECPAPGARACRRSSDAARGAQGRLGFGHPRSGRRGRGASSPDERRPRREDGAPADTTLDLPLVVLPARALAATRFLLRPCPSRSRCAGADVVTLCTKAHSIVVEDPIASTPDAQPKPNPPPRPQREEWLALERGVSWGLLGVVLGALVAWTIHRWHASARSPVVPPPPPSARPGEVRARAPRPGAPHRRACSRTTSASRISSAA